MKGHADYFNNKSNKVIEMSENLERENKRLKAENERIKTAYSIINADEKVNYFKGKCEELYEVNEKLKKDAEQLKAQLLQANTKNKKCDEGCLRKEQSNEDLLKANGSCDCSWCTTILSEKFNAFFKKLLKTCRDKNQYLKDKIETLKQKEQSQMQKNACSVCHGKRSTPCIACMQNNEHEEYFLPKLEK